MFFQSSERPKQEPAAVFNSKLSPPLNATNLLPSEILNLLSSGLHNLNNFQAPESTSPNQAMLPLNKPTLPFPNLLSLNNLSTTAPQNLILPTVNGSESPTKTEFKLRPLTGNATLDIQALLEQLRNTIPAHPLQSPMLPTKAASPPSFAQSVLPSALPLQKSWC
eukprot:1662636-Rhodomonas_salina.1